MPTYEYECQICSLGFEVEKSIKDDSAEECPVCLTTQTKRLISSGTSFTLKGGGWAADNYGSSKKSSG